MKKLPKLSLIDFVLITGGAYFMCKKFIKKKDAPAVPATPENPKPLPQVQPKTEPKKPEPAKPVVLTNLPVFANKNNVYILNAPKANAGVLKTQNTGNLLGYYVTSFTETLPLSKNVYVQLQDLRKIPLGFVNAKNVYLSNGVEKINL